MKKAMVLLAVLMTGVAFASERAAGEGEKEDVAGYILHHVSDSPMRVRDPAQPQPHRHPPAADPHPAEGGGCAVDATGTCCPAAAAWTSPSPSTR